MPAASGRAVSPRSCRGWLLPGDCHMSLALAAFSPGVTAVAQRGSDDGAFPRKPWARGLSLGAAGPLGDAGQLSGNGTAFI